MKLKFSETRSREDLWNKILDYKCNYNLKYLLIKRKIFYKNKKYIDVIICNN